MVVVLVLVVPVGAVEVVPVVGVLLVGVVAVAGLVAVVGGEVNVGPADAATPTVRPAVGCFFGGGFVGVCLLTRTAFAEDAGAAAGCGAELA